MTNQSEKHKDCKFIRFNSTGQIGCETHEKCELFVYEDYQGKPRYVCVQGEKEANQ